MHVYSYLYVGSIYKIKRMYILKIFVVLAPLNIVFTPYQKKFNDSNGYVIVLNIHIKILFFLKSFATA